MSNSIPSSFDDQLTSIVDEFDTEKKDELVKKTDAHLDINEVKRQLFAVKDQIDSLIRLLNVKEIHDESIPSSQFSLPSSSPIILKLSSDERIIEGVFNGEKMVGPDGQEYAIPPNYASKSKLVEGDMMKLTITKAGTFIYKQIGPIERIRVIGSLMFDQENQRWSVVVNGKSYKVLTASITFYKGKPYDEVVVLIPKDGQSDWGAVENIISK
jgi:hypothetical protein